MQKVITFETNRRVAKKAIKANPQQLKNTPKEKSSIENLKPSPLGQPCLHEKNTTTINNDGIYSYQFFELYIN